jgi:hypothetical protein
MNASRPSRLRAFVASAVVVAGFALGGCFNPFSPRIAPVLGISKPAPVPSSASGVLRLFEWCYNNKAIAEYREIFTDDYRFFFSPLDSAGAEWRGTPYTREDEMISATNLFVGGSATEPAASSIRLSLDRNFFVYPDPNFTPWDPLGRWHKNIRTTVTLVIGTDDGNSIEITGHANFYMVRGDSAVIPEELRLRGFGPDSNRWYIRRWDDETAQSEGATLAAGPAAAPRLAGTRRAAPAAAREPAAGLRATRVADARPLAGQPWITASWGAVKAYYHRTGAAPTLAQGP